MKGAALFGLMYFITCTTSTLAQNYDFDSHVSIQLYHALDANNQDSFTSRGNISVLSINTGELVVNQKEMSQKEIQLIADLAKKNKFYRLKADVVGSDGIKTTFLTSSKACHLIISQLHDLLTISFDHNSAVLGINHKPVNLEIVPDQCDHVSLNGINEFSSVVILKGVEQAPIPDTAGFIQKIEKEREARDRGETKDNRSFVSKYWMYIVPAVILLLISGVTNPETPGAAPAN